MNTESLDIARTAVRLYAESHPRPPHVTQKQAAEMLHISYSKMLKLVKARKVKINKFGLIPISEVDAALTSS